MITEYEFELPRGYVDSNGDVHKRGKMRLATAGDEISATRDPRVLSNPSYLSVVVLAKVITELEGMPTIVPNIVERFSQRISPFCRTCISGSTTLSRRR